MLHSCRGHAISVGMENVAETSKPPATRSKLLRSAASNGSRQFAVGGDGRGAWVRRYKDLIEDHAACYGGEANLSVPRMSMLRRQAAAIVECEQIEARMSQGAATVADSDEAARV